MDNIPGAGKVVGPRPGKAACSFAQGVVELLLRLGEGIVGVLPLVTGALVLGFNADYFDAGSASGPDNTAALSGDLQAQTNASGSLCLIAGILAVAWAIIMIVLRFLNIGLLNLGSKYFLAVDIIVNIVIFIVSLVAGIITAIFAGEWRNGDDAVYGSMIAASVCAFIGCLFPIILAVYMILYVAKNWNLEIIKYTLKDAIM